MMHLLIANHVRKEEKHSPVLMTLHGQICLALVCCRSHRIKQPDGTLAERFAEDVP